MSPSTAAQSNNAADNARRRRACDVCRRSKIRCNVSMSDETPCAHCSRFNLECTFIDDTKRKTPSKGYITKLENRCKNLELLVKRIAPDIDIDKEVGPSFTQDTWSDVVAPSQLASATPAQGTVEVPRTSSTSLHDDPMIDTEEDIKEHLQKHLAELQLDTDVPNCFHGKSSGYELIRVALNLKDSAIGGTPGATIKSASPRVEFWAPALWKTMVTPLPPLSAITWPPDDLLKVLIEIYFDQILPMLPVLYRPAFDKNLKNGLHKTDSSFAKLLLALCALSSQFCEDPRVCLQKANGTTDWPTAGWKYFSQLLKMNQAIFGRASLCSLQTLAIACTYLQYITAPHLAWLLSGIGIRFALDIGLHREKVYVGDQSLENQLWKRVFWALVGIDTLMSSRLGRPAAVSLEEVDAELPLEVSDEYYNEATKRWDQPPGKPCHISGFVQFIKVEKIMARALQTVYGVRHPTPSAVADLDNALNKWLDELPLHLRWDPMARDLVHQKHSALLRLIFLHIQIVVHRRFLPVMLQEDVGESSALSASALAICTTAAQATIRVLETFELMGSKELPSTGFAFGAATILLLNMWDTQRKGPLNVDVSGHLEDVQRCIRILRGSERRWKNAGRLVDILTELSSMSEAHLRQPAPAGRQKRSRDDMDDDAQSASRHFQPDFSNMPSASASTTPLQQSDEGPQMPTFSLVPGVLDISAIQWDPLQPAGFMPSIGSYPVPRFGIPGLVGEHMGPSESEASLPGVALPIEAFQQLFGNMDDMYSVVGQLPPAEPFGNDVYGTNIDWATELSFLGMNIGTEDSIPPSNP